MSYRSEYSLGVAIAGEKMIAMFPKYKTPTAAVGVLYCHGAGSDATSAQTFGGAAEVLAKLADTHPVLSCDLGGLAPWANDASIAKVDQAYTYLTNQMGALPGKVVLVGTSMGGATQAVWAAKNQSKVSCMVGLIPVCDISDIVVNNRTGAAASINVNYVGGWTENVYGATHNPQTLALAGKFAGIPIRTYYGNTDLICVPATQLAFAAASGAIATQLNGDHTSTTLAQVSPAEVAAFVASNT